MNRSDLILKFIDFAKIPKRNAEIVVDTIFDSMRKTLEDDQRVDLRGFGSFANKNYDAYVGRNPRTGETINVPAKRLTVFKVGKELKEMVNKGKRD